MINAIYNKNYHLWFRGNNMFTEISNDIAYYYEHIYLIFLNTRKPSEMDRHWLR